jgi:hypothetical protein
VFKNLYGPGFPVRDSRQVRVRFIESDELHRKSGGPRLL